MESKLYFKRTQWVYTMCYRMKRMVLFLIVLSWATTAPVFAISSAPPREPAEVHSPSAAVVLADGVSIGKLFYGGGRTRIVQVCAVVMSIALFIMMRKLD